MPIVASDTRLRSCHTISATDLFHAVVARRSVIRKNQSPPVLCRRKFDMTSALNVFEHITTPDSGLITRLRAAVYRDVTGLSPTIECDVPDGVLLI
jgi:hypothetical protein